MAIEATRIANLNEQQINEFIFKVFRIRLKKPQIIDTKIDNEIKEPLGFEKLESINLDSVINIDNSKKENFPIDVSDNDIDLGHLSDSNFENVLGDFIKDMKDI